MQKTSEEVLAKFYSLPLASREKVVVDFITAYPNEAQSIIQQKKEALTTLRSQTSKAAYGSKKKGFTFLLGNGLPATLYRLDNEEVRGIAAKVKDMITERCLQYYYTMTVNIEGQEISFIFSHGLGKIVEYCQKMEELPIFIRWVVFDTTLYYSYEPTGQLLINAVVKKMNPNVLAVISTKQQTSNTG